MLPSHESVPVSDPLGSTASTNASANEKLSDLFEPAQTEWPFQNTENANIRSFAMQEATTHQWTCECPAKVSSLLEHLTPRCVTGVTRASGKPLLCNLDAIISRNEDPLRKVNVVLRCYCSCSVSVVLHLAAIMLKILGWYSAIIGIVVRCKPRFQTTMSDSRDTFSWIGDFFEPYDAGIDSPERARGYLLLLLSKLDAIRPIVHALAARLLAPGRQSTLDQSPLSNRIENITRTLLRAGGLCGTLSCRSIACAFEAELRGRFEESRQLLMDALNTL